MKWGNYLKSNLFLWLGLTLLVAVPRLTHLNGYLIVDETDRWRWANDFVIALSHGNLAGTLVGDGYPGIVPVWAETIWIMLEAARRSLSQGEWIGQAGLSLLLHQWERSEMIQWQRLPIAMFNTVLALAMIGSVWRAFGKRVALASGLLIALDPFYLSDSRVNRAEALTTGLMTLSILCWLFYAQNPRQRYVILSGFLAGLSFLTKIQAVVIIPAIVLIMLWVKPHRFLKPVRFLEIFFIWLGTACLTWFILWPAMWVTPLETLSLVYHYTTRKIGDEGINLFFWGQTYQNADPGLLFYPFVFIMRLTPLTMVGLVALGFLKSKIQSYALDSKSAILLIYIITYALIMTVGSHKQDRYLMPIFPSINILAALGLVSILEVRSKEYGVRSKSILASYSLLLTPYSLLLTSYFLLQIATIYPHHPYYYSYFNPLLGGGYTAVRTLRVGWGEGMDQVGAYLAAKPNSRELVVASRFVDNMLGFKGKVVGIGSDGRWTKADYIVLYIQQVQRRQEPSPAFFDYFQARTPEKIITIGGIDYAWIYPRPFDLPANPQISRLNSLALLGCSLEKDTLRTMIKGLKDLPGLQNKTHLENPLILQIMVTRLVGNEAKTKWAGCQVDPKFTIQAQTPGQYVESLCRLDLPSLPTDTYTLEFGVAKDSLGLIKVEPIPFPEGWQALRLTATGTLTYTAPGERFDLIARQTVPTDAHLVTRLYNKRLRLLAYDMTPTLPKSGDTVDITLYWQAMAELATPLKLEVKIADSRLISLGRHETRLPTKNWLNGAVITTRHQFRLPAELAQPLAAQLEINLRNEADVLWTATTATGQRLDQTLARLTINAPSNSRQPAEKTNTAWQNGLTLKGYHVSAHTLAPTDTLRLSLFWEARQPISQSYVIFAHLVNEQGQIIAQHDSLPNDGAYPTPWWPSGILIEDDHAMPLPATTPPGLYHLRVGFYEVDSLARLPLADERDSVLVTQIEIK